MSSVVQVGIFVEKLEVVVLFSSFSPVFVVVRGRIAVVREEEA